MNRIISILIIIMILMMCIANTVLAADPIISALEQTDLMGSGTSGDTLAMKKMARNILGIIQIIGYGIAIIMLTILGMKYIISSTDEKAKIKEKLIPYVIGAVLLFGAGLILEIIKTFVIGINV